MKYLIILRTSICYLCICYDVILYSMINTLAYEISQVHIEREVHRDSPIKSLFYYDGMWYVQSQTVLRLY